MKKLILVISLLPIFVGAKPKLLITGSSTIAPVLTEIAEKYEAEKKVRVDIQTGGSTKGAIDIKKGLSNIGMVSKAIKEADLKTYLIAKDGLALIVNKKNKVLELSKEKVKNIYLGKITNWSQLGGENAPITVVHKAQGRATLKVFLKAFKLKNTEIKPNIIVGDNEQGVKTIANDKNAIGYVSVGAAIINQKYNVPISLIKLDGVEPSIKNIKNGKYPIVRELNLVTGVRPDKESLKFIKYIYSSAAKKIIERNHFVPVSQKK